VKVEPPVAPKPPDLPAELEEVELGHRALGALRLEGVHVRGADLSDRAAPDLTLLEARLDDVVLDAAEAAGIRLRDVVVARGSWAGLRTSRGTIDRVEASGVRGTGADLAETELADVVFADCRFDLASFRHATLARVVFRDCRLEEADFGGATLSSVRFERCSLAGASVHAASFSRCELRACDLTGLVGAASLGGTRMTRVDLLGIADLLAGALGIEVVE